MKLPLIIKTISGIKYWGFKVKMAPRKPIIPIYEVPKKRIAPNGVRLPDPISEGEVFTDSSLKRWKLGRSIGLGGFGEIYLGEFYILYFTIY